MKAGRWKLGRRGATLVLVTTIGVIVGILAMAMIQLGYHARMLAVRSVQGISARCAADAGMVEAVFKMQKKLITDPYWDSSTLPPTVTNAALAGCTAKYGYVISGSESAGYQIDATGAAGIATRAVHLTLEVGSYWEGIGVKNSVDVRMNTVFDVVGGGLPGDMVIRSNSTASDAMKFKAFVVVPGDVLCGPGGNPDQVIDVKATTVIQGQTYAATETLTFPPVQAPIPADYYKAAITTTSPLLTDVNEVKVYQYPSIQTPTKGVIEITPLVSDVNHPVIVYVVGDMVMNNGSEFVVRAGSAAAVYLGENLVNQNSVGFSNENTDPRRLKIYNLPTIPNEPPHQIDLKAKTDLYAAIYAPDAILNLYNSGDFYGSLTADSFEMKNSGNFHFDARLKSGSIDDPAAVFVVGRWWEN